jgi:hypothetical protein
VPDKELVPEKNLVIVFPTTHLTLKAESVFEKAGIVHRTVMKPRKISSDCGLAIRVKDDDLRHIRELLNEGSIEPLGFYKESDGAWEPVSVREDR